VAPTVPTAGGSSPTAEASSTRLNKTQDAGPIASKKSSSASSGGGVGLVGWVLMPLALIVLLLVPRVARSLVRRRRWARARDARAFVEAGWRELRDSALDLGVPWDDRVTLRTAAASLTRSFTSPHDPAVRLPRRGPSAAPDAEEALERLVGLLERARYSRGLPDDATTGQQVAADVDTCVAALRAGVDRRHRLVADWFPSSLLYAVRTQGPGAPRGDRPLGEAGVDRAV
jgi:hypothetical protein